MNHWAEGEFSDTIIGSSRRSICVNADRFADADETVRLRFVEELSAA